MMNRIGYQALGFAVWKGARWYIRQRFTGGSRKMALAGLLLAGVAALALAGRKATSE